MTDRLLDIGTLPAVVITPDGVIDVCLSNIAGLNVYRIAEILRERTVDLIGN
jgi:hypothetical protein